MKDCPDRYGPSMKGKRSGKSKFGMVSTSSSLPSNFLTDEGKGKGKFYGKTCITWSMTCKGTYKGHVNVYGMEMCPLEFLDVHTSSQSMWTASPAAYASQARPLPTPPSCGMVDCGAAASAGPEASIQRLKIVLKKVDPQSTFHFDPHQRPHFRYDSGKWGNDQDYTNEQFLQNVLMLFPAEGDSVIPVPSSDDGYKPTEPVATPTGERDDPEPRPPPEPLPTSITRRPAKLVARRWRQVGHSQYDMVDEAPQHPPQEPSKQVVEVAPSISSLSCTSWTSFQSESCLDPS